MAFLPGFCNGQTTITTCIIQNLMKTAKDFITQLIGQSQILSDLQPYSKKYGLTITKPYKYRAGETSTLAIIRNVF